MLLRVQQERLGLPATVVTANLPKDTLVSMTASKTVDKAGADTVVIGRLVVPAKTANTQGTIETRFKELVEIKTAAIVAFGAPVKLAAVDGTTGENRVTNWVAGTDSATLLYGIAWKNAASGGVAEVLVY